MIDNEQQLFSDENNSQIPAGRMTGSDQSQFEEQLFTDDDLAVRVRLAELELSDEYASKRLSDRERQVFRERFLLTGDRKQALKVSTALGDRFSARATEHSVIGDQKTKSTINQALEIRVCGPDSVLCWQLFCS